MLNNDPASSPAIGRMISAVIVPYMQTYMSAP